MSVYIIGSNICDCSEIVNFVFIVMALLTCRVEWTTCENWLLGLRLLLVASLIILGYKATALSNIGSKVIVKSCCLCGTEGAGLVPWMGGPPDASFGFYLREAFQSQTNTENILYNKSR